MPGQPASGQQQPDIGQTPASGTSRSTGSPATGATSSSSSEQRTGSTDPRARQASSEPVQRSQTTTTRTYEQPRRKGGNKKIALLGILGLLAVAGIITGFAASNSSSSPVAAVHRTVPHVPAAHSSTPSYRVLTTFNGSWTKTSATFTVTNPSAAHWGFNCASGTHSFSASMATTSGADRIPIVSTSGTRNTGTVILHPSSTGTPYKITASSACPFSIRVYGT